MPQSSLLRRSGACLLLLLACNPPVTGKGAGPGMGAGGTTGGGNNPGGGNDPGGGAGGGNGGQNKPDAGFTFNPPEAGAGPEVRPGAPTEGNTCGFQRHQLDRLQPELMLVLDRSGSMNFQADDPTKTRWEETSAALVDVLTQTDGTIAWGLKAFPAPEGCLVAPGVEVAISPTTKPIVDVVNMTMPNSGASGTPTGAAVEDAATYLRGRGNRNPKYMVLATDGAPTCPQEDFVRAEREAILAVETARAADIATFVIGIAITGSDEDRILGALARAGGRARAGAEPYYPVKNRKELVDALAMIGKVVASCTFTLDKDPPSPNDVAVDVDGMRVMRDQSQMNGWNYTMAGNNRSITLYGPACERVKAGTVKDVDIIFGCPNVPIP